MKSLKFIFIISIAIMIFGCKEESILKAYGPNDGIAPGIVTINSYEAIPGGVIINYKAPSDEDLLYVKAEYTLDTGQKREVRASVYSRELKIEGFGHVGEKDIVLSAIDRHENIGESTAFKVIPGRPGYLSAYETLKTSATFGGIAILLENEDRSNLIIDVMTTDSIGQWYAAQTEYTSRRDIKFAVRGFDTIPRNFKISIRDPWDNRSEESSYEVKPLFEKQLEREKFRKFALPTDTSVDEWGFTMELLWSGQVGWGSWNMCHSNNFDNFPAWFTFDMGVKAKLSRYQYWQRLSDQGNLYTNGCVKQWEIWGHPDTPPLDGSWDGWIKLIDCESIKPSGSPLGVVTAEDIEYATKGDEFEFSLDAPPVRYIRFKALSTFSGSTVIHLQQLWFFGEEIK